MSKMTGGSFVWVCPQCSRRVPNHVVVCRCGYQPPAEIESPRPAALAADVGPRRQRVPWALIWSGISMVLLAVLAVQWSSSDTTHHAAWGLFGCGFAGNLGGASRCGTALVRPGAGSD